MRAENSVKISGKTTDNDLQMGDEFATKRQNKKGRRAPLFWHVA